MIVLFMFMGLAIGFSLCLTEDEIDELNKRFKKK